MADYSRYMECGMGRYDINDIKEFLSWERPRKKCFNRYGTPLKGDWLTFNFWQSLYPIFKKETGLSIYEKDGEYGKYYSLGVSDESKKDIIKEWIQKYSSIVFLKDLLGVSIALDYNFTDAKNGKYTELGKLEHDAKTVQCQDSIIKLAKHTTNFINDVELYKDADFICTVPPAPGKTFDMPSEVVQIVSKDINKYDLTEHFQFKEDKHSIKKLDEWNRVGLSMDYNLDNKDVILIDDKYQSGITLQYIAMKLKEAGARNVYGLTFVKTLKDTDNV